MKTILMHYSVPGLPPHAARSTSYGDAEDMARALAARTGTPSAVLAHYFGDGAEVIELSAVIAPDGRPLKIAPQG